MAWLWFSLRAIQVGGVHREGNLSGIFAGYDLFCQLCFSGEATVPFRGISFIVGWSQGWVRT